MWDKVDRDNKRRYFTFLVQGEGKKKMSRNISVNIMKMFTSATTY